MTPEETARLEAIERRLALLEATVGMGRHEHASLPIPPAPVPPVPKFAPPVAAPRPRPERSHSLETAFGLNWLSRIAVLTIVLALAFFFKYAFENHWISEWERVLAGAGAGFAALGFGERFWRGEQRAYGQALTAAGVCFLYLSCWAAFGLYHLLPQPAIFALMIVTTAGSGVLALRYDSAAVAMLGLAGGFATPLLLGSQQDLWFVFGYALVLDASASLAARLRNWRWTELLALAGTILLYLDQVSGQAQSLIVFTLFVVAWYVLFAASRFIPVFLIAQVLAGLALVQIWQPGTGVLPALWIVAAAGLAVADWRGWSMAVTASFAGFWLAYASWRAQAGTPPTDPVLALLTASYALFLAWPVWRACLREKGLRFQDLALIAINAALYFGAGYGLLSSGYGAWQGLFAVGVAVVQMGAARWLWGHDARGSLLSAGAAWVLLVLAAPIQFAGYRITLAWAIEGGALVWIGVRLRNRSVVATALGIFVLVCGRLAALDSLMYASPNDYGLLGNARFLTFAIAAASLWAAAWWIRQGAHALITYLGGHFIMLWGLSLEAAGWAERTAAGQDVRSVVSMSISVLAAAYALLLVGGGVARRSAVTRVSGVVLIALVVLKLYLYDVWLLGQFYRMAAFAILGVLLLAMSYLYSRFRGSIDTWWRP